MSAAIPPVPERLLLWSVLIAFGDMATRLVDASAHREGERWFNYRKQLFAACERANITLGELRMLVYDQSRKAREAAEWVNLLHAKSSPPAPSPGQAETR